VKNRNGPSKANGLFFHPIDAAMRNIQNHATAARRPSIRKNQHRRRTDPKIYERFLGGHWASVLSRF
jgi:hypothetical protein